MRIIDITRPVSGSLALWPGDTPFRLHRITDFADGGVNLGAVTMSLHTGTHVDAPFHVTRDGRTIEELDLSVFAGPAIVADARGCEMIRVADLEHVDLGYTPRVLLKTGCWPHHARFPERIPALAEDVPAYLAERGVVLVGTDAPTVDSPARDDLPVHHALIDRGICILESLDLGRADPGRYELIALPLRLFGADGSPVRAVLVSRE